MSPFALEARGLTVALRSGASIVENVEICLGPGEILGLVGESGSGKTTTALALLGYQAPGVTIVSGELSVAGRALKMDESMRSARGSMIAYVPQNPGRALNPALRIDKAIEELLRAHGQVRARAEVASELLSTVGLDSARGFARRYPHQLSGGQQQRVCIALALTGEPPVVVLDEPTTGLDVVTQTRILDELLRLRDERGVAMVYVSHDLAVVSQIATRIAVMYAGRIVEQGPAEQVLRSPAHPYTRGLLASVPDHVRPRRLDPMPGVAVGVGERPDGCAFAPRCPQRTDACVVGVPALRMIGERHEVRCLHWETTPAVNSAELPPIAPVHADAGTVLEVKHLTAEHHGHGERVIAANDVSFELRRGACLALVGESGSGKTTIARAIAGLHPISGGSIVLDGVELPSLARARSVTHRRLIQLIFQNPADALNPRHTVGDSVARPARLLRQLTKQDARAEVVSLLEQVRLPLRVISRYPGELSGGERQRVAIARALAATPDVILCDEITSALDVSVQAAVLELLSELRSELGLSLLFITHNLGVVATIADQVIVLENGKICEQATTASILGSPEHPYTQRLLNAAPSITATAVDTEPDRSPRIEASR